MVQEHHMLDDKITAVHGRLKREGWSSWFAAAVATAGGKGSSGGVGFIWRPFLALSSRPVQVVAGRAACAGLRSAKLGTIMLYPLYGWTGRPGRTEAELYQPVREHTRAHGLPWIAGGDHNMGADQACEAWGSAAWIAAPPGITCESSAGPGGTLYFFIAHPALRHAVQSKGAWVDEQALTYPHKPVMMELASAAADVKVDVWRRAPAGPTKAVCGSQGQ